MKFEINGPNAATAHLNEGEQLAFDGDFLRGHKLGSPFPPFRWSEAFFPRLLTGRLSFSIREAWESETIDLSKEKNFFETRVTEYKTGGALEW